MKKQKQPTSIFWTKRKLVITVSLLLLFVLFDISPFGGNVRFYSKWAACAQKPVASRVGFNMGRPLSYEEPAAFEPIRYGLPRYFCTPLEAEKAGYSANPNSYEFPNLDKQKSQN